MKRVLIFIIILTLSVISCSKIAQDETTPIPTVIGGLTAPESIVLSAQSKGAQVVSIGSADEPLTISASGSWFGIVESCKVVSKGEVQSVKIWSEPNFSTTARNSVVTVTGAKSGVSVTIPVSQPAYFTTITEAFPARLETQSSRYDSSRWSSNGVVSPLNSSAVLCVVAPSGKALDYTLNSGPVVANMAKGDYLLYAIPTAGVAAGEQIDFMCTIAAAEATSPKYFIFEYWDEGRWKSVKNSLRTAEDGLKYSLLCRHFNSAYHTTFTQSFTLTEPIKNGCVKVRLRTLSDGVGGICIPSNSGYMGMYMIKYPEAPLSVDTKRVLFIGNSFTYYYGTAFMFKEIARTEGHQVDAVIGVKGSQSFAEHLTLEMSLDAIKQGGYHYAFLQDTSPNPAIYAEKGTKAILNACNQINALTLNYSPSCQIVYERTWACPYSNYRGYGSYDKLDYLLKTGIEMLQREVDCDVIVSPIGLGFRVARGENINLLHTDDRHQNRAGAYMKACINYLTVYNSRFTAGVSDCGVEATLAKSIRDIAERVVFEGVEENYNFE